MGDCIVQAQSYSYVFTCETFESDDVATLHMFNDASCYFEFSPLFAVENNVCLPNPAFPNKSLKFTWAAAVSSDVADVAVVATLYSDASCTTVESTSDTPAGTCIGAGTSVLSGVPIAVYQRVVPGLPWITPSPTTTSPTTVAPTPSLAPFVLGSTERRVSCCSAQLTPAEP